MDKDISVCGSNCSTCYCFIEKMCKGCNLSSGVVFHTSDRECPIYHCSRTKNQFKSCLECDKIPCEIWKKTRDPKFSDEEFLKNINDRIELLKEQVGIKQ